MQKISSYLYPNKIAVVADLAAYQTEWRIVYQRRIKIYKGVSNILEFDFKNAQQRPIDISGYNIKCIITELNGLEIVTSNVIPAAGKTGLAIADIPADVFDHVSPQFLNYALYLIDETGRRIPVYADTQFGAVGKIELLDGIFAKSQPKKEIETFLYTVNDVTPNSLIRTYYSSATEVKPLNDINDSTTISVDFVFNNLTADVTVETSNSEVISSATNWKDLETFQVTPATTFLTKTYFEISDYTNKVTWLRIKYKPTVNTTGTIEKVFIRFNDDPYNVNFSSLGATSTYTASDFDLNGGTASSTYETTDTFLNGGGA